MVSGKLGVNDIKCIGASLWQHRIPWAWCVGTLVMISIVLSFPCGPWVFKHRYTSSHALQPIQWLLANLPICNYLSLNTSTSYQVALQAQINKSHGDLPNYGPFSWGTWWSCKLSQPQKDRSPQWGVFQWLFRIPVIHSGHCPLRDMEELPPFS